MTLKRIIIILAIFSWNSISWSQGVSKIGTTAAPFLQIGAGSRATALGEAYTAVGEDASSLYWNPAGIDNYGGNDVVFNYSDWFGGMKYVNADAVLHLGDIGSFGASITSFSTPEMIVRTVDEPEGLGTKFDADDIALGIGYAKRITDRFSFGANFKYISRRIWHMNASAIAMDFGILYQLPWKNLKLGMAIQNFGSKLQIQGADAIVFHDIEPTMSGNNDQVMSSLYTKEWALPLSFKFGLSYKLQFADDHNILLAADYIHPNDNVQSVNMGGEYGFLNTVFFRVGYKSMFVKDATFGLTCGGGIKLSFAQVDYSYMKLEYLGSVQQFSVSLTF